jgi:hypothetical protein
MGRRSDTGQMEGYSPPREDINSPDLYIPVMAFVTYVLLCGLAAGRKGRWVMERKKKFRLQHIVQIDPPVLTANALQLSSRSPGIYRLSFFSHCLHWSLVDSTRYISPQHTLGYLRLGSDSLLWLQVRWRNRDHCRQATWLWWYGDLGSIPVYLAVLWIFLGKLYVWFWTSGMETLYNWPIWPYYIIWFYFPNSCDPCDTWHCQKLEPLLPWTLNEKEECGSCWWLLPLKFSSCSCLPNKQNAVLFFVWL